MSQSRTVDSTRYSSALQLAHVAATKWELVQVELQGKYSLQRMRAFYAYSIQTRWYRVLLSCFLTPISSLVVNILLDIPPLAPPSAGRNANFVFWARFAIASIIVAYTSFLQIGYLTPGLGMTRWHALSTAIVVSISCTTASYVLAGTIAMPIPFQLLVTSPVYAISTTIMLGYYFGSRLKNDVELRAAFSRSLGFIGEQLCLMCTYPAFIFGFNTIPSKYQTPYMVIIPVLKIIAKNVMSRLIGSNDDLKSVELIFNVDCFNAIYVSLAMQRATTISTSLIVMVIDVIQGCVSVYDVYLGFQPLKHFMNDLPKNHPLYGKNFLEVAIALDQEVDPISREKQTFDKALFGPTFLTNSAGSRTATKVFVAPCAANRDITCNTRMESGVCSSEKRATFLLATRKLLFTTEFILLVEYTEVIMPVFYSFLMAATYYLPNRVFYSTIADIDEHELWTMVTNVFMYTSLELMSLIVIDFVLRRITGVSAMRQVGFVLDRQRVTVQYKLLLWITYAVQNTLQHLGADFSFQFKWLHSK